MTCFDFVNAGKCSKAREIGHAESSKQEGIAVLWYQRCGTRDQAPFPWWYHCCSCVSGFWSSQQSWLAERPYCIPPSCEYNYCEECFTPCCPCGVNWRIRIYELRGDRWSLFTTIFFFFKKWLILADGFLPFPCYLSNVVWSLKIL